MISNWMDIIAERIELVPARYLLHPVLEEVSSYERIIGRLSPDLRKLHALMSELRDDAKRKLAGHVIQHVNGEHEENSGTCFEFGAEEAYLKKQAEIVRDVFWFSVKYELKFFTGNFGIRKDWKVVTWDERDELAVKEQQIIQELQELIQSGMTPGELEELLLAATLDRGH